MRVCLVLLLALFIGTGARAQAAPLIWQKWEPGLFERAAREDKYILLNMAAVWCHWCHVMEETTYADPRVQARIAGKFIPVRVDQDSDPVLSYRYERWGWPATIIFDKDGNEIFKRQGYIPPELFEKLLLAVIDDPSALPDQEAASAPNRGPLALTPERIARTEELLTGQYDKANGGFGETQRFVHGDTIEWLIERGRQLKRNPGADGFRRMAEKTLAGARHLIDPVWGGMFQYSDKPDWSGPHYEKLLNIQRDALRVYVLAYEAWHDPADLAAAQSIARWLVDFMQSPDGGIYTSQDADAGADLPGAAFYAKDDAARRAGPQPPIDRHLYARENGWAVGGLAALYDVTGDERLLAAAKRALAWTLANRRAPNGGLGHARADNDDTSLGDTLAVAEAALALYRSTGDRPYLALAAQLGDVIIRDHQDPDGGYRVRRPDPASRGALAKSVRQIDENVAVVRLLNLLARDTSNPAYHAAALHGMRLLAAWIEDDLVVPGALLAARELAREPAHVTVVGNKDDPRAQALYAAARRYPTRYLRIEWLDRREGPLPSADIDYPELDQAAAFACANGACSIPVHDPAKVAETVARVDDR